MQTGSGSNMQDRKMRTKTKHSVTRVKKNARKSWGKKFLKMPDKVRLVVFLSLKAGTLVIYGLTCVCGQTLLLFPAFFPRHSSSLIRLSFVCFGCLIFCFAGCFERNDAGLFVFRIMERRGKPSEKPSEKQDKVQIAHLLVRARITTIETVFSRFSFSWPSQSDQRAFGCLLNRKKWQTQTMKECKRLRCNSSAALAQLNYYLDNWFDQSRSHWMKNIVSSLPASERAQETSKQTHMRSLEKKTGK